MSQFHVLYKVEGSVIQHFTLHCFNVMRLSVSIREPCASIVNGSHRCGAHYLLIPHRFPHGGF